MTGVEELKEGTNYIIQLKNGIEPIVDNEGNTGFRPGKKYKMYLKNRLCYIERDDLLNEYLIHIHYKHLLEYYFNIEEA